MGPLVATLIQFSYSNSSLIGNRLQLQVQAGPGLVKCGGTGIGPVAAPISAKMYLFMHFHLRGLEMGVGAGARLYLHTKDLALPPGPSGTVHQSYKLPIESFSCIQYQVLCNQYAWYCQVQAVHTRSQLSSVVYIHTYCVPYIAREK